jgi:hypothetical protein
MIPGTCEDRVEAERRPCDAIVGPTRDANPQHPHDRFTTASFLWPILADMQTNEATLAPTTAGPSERPSRTGSEPAGPRAVVAGADRGGHARMTTQALAAMPTAVDARGAA